MLLRVWRMWIVGLIVGAGSSGPPTLQHCTGHCVHRGGTEFVCVDNINIPCVYLDNIHTLEHFLNFLTIQLSGVCGRCQFLDKYVLKICQFFRTIRVNTHKQNVRLQKYLNKKISDHGWTEVKFSVVICTKSPWTVNIVSCSLRS